MMDTRENSFYWSDDKYKSFVEWHKKVLVHLSIFERKRQYEDFQKICRPSPNSSVLDVGFSANKEVLADTNLFEKIYPYQNRITAACVEDVDPETRSKYPDIKLQKIEPYRPLPYDSLAFDIVTAWATLEHVGDYQDQKRFVQEVFRVGKTVYLTTPYRGAPYEPHTGVFFFHWLPLAKFRSLLVKMGKDIWAQVSNLNPLYKSDVERMIEGIPGALVKVHWTLGIVPSHLIIYREKGAK
jgi:hypothetical protein